MELDKDESHTQFLLVNAIRDWKIILGQEMPGDIDPETIERISKEIIAKLELFRRLLNIEDFGETFFNAVPSLTFNETIFLWVLVIALAENRQILGTIVREILDFMQPGRAQAIRTELLKRANNKGIETEEMNALFKIYCH